MVADRVTFKLIPLTLLGASALLVGSGIYVLARDPAMLYMMNLPGASFRALSPQPILAAELTFVTAALPTAIHAFAFSLITAPLLRPYRYAIGASCLLWGCTNSVFEFLQYPHLYPSVLLSDNPIARLACAYAANGTFDMLDLAFAWLGSGLAYLALKRLSQAPEE